MYVVSEVRQDSGEETGARVVRWFVFHVYKSIYVAYGFRVEGAHSAYYNGNDIDVVGPTA